MARPKERQPRDQQLNISLTREELAAIKHRAEALGMRIAHFGRAVLLDAKNIGARKDGAASRLGQLNYSALARLGNNLNQMMRHLHQTGEPLPADLEPLLKDIRGIIARGSAQ